VAKNEAFDGIVALARGMFQNFLNSTLYSLYRIFQSCGKAATPSSQLAFRIDPFTFGGGLTLRFKGR